MIQVMKRARHEKSTMTRRERARAFLIGFASAFDLAGVMYQPPRRSVKDPQQEDAEAIASDWRAVGEDLVAAARMHRAR